MSNKICQDERSVILLFYDLKFLTEIKASWSGADEMHQEFVAIIVMGVSGCGKTTITPTLYPTPASRARILSLSKDVVGES